MIRRTLTAIIAAATLSAAAPAVADAFYWTSTVGPGQHVQIPFEPDGVSCAALNGARYSWRTIPDRDGNIIGTLWELAGAAKVSHRHSDDMLIGLNEFTTARCDAWIF